MSSGKKVLSLLLAVILIFSLFGTALAAESVNNKDIVILYTNDVHCAAEDNIGYAGLASYKADMLKATDYVSLVDAGDSLQGGVLGTLSRGSYITDIMNELDYDVAVPGNHEFDYGMENFLTIAKNLSCGYLSCNFIDLKTKAPVFDSYKIISYGDTKVAYIGIDTPESISKSTPTYFQDASGNYIYGFCSGNNGQELYTAVQKAVDAAILDGANYVIAVGHCGIEEQSAPWRSTDIIKNVTGLTAFIDGHSHSTIAEQGVTDKDGKKVVLTSSGTKLSSIGKLSIKTDGSVSSELISNYEVKDAAVKSFIGSLNAKNKALLDTVVAKSDVALTTKSADGTRAVRSKETNLGDLTADAYRVVGGADIGFSNGGGVRADISAGDIKYGDIINVFPFNNSLCVVEATGQEIIDALEMSARVCPYENGGFLQVSGLKFSIDTTIPTSVQVDSNKMFVSVDGDRRVKDVSVLNDSSGEYEPIVLAKTYTLASHDYLLKFGGDGFNMFSDNKLLKDSIMLDNQVLIDYITGNLKGVVPTDYSASEGRISIKYKVSYLYCDVPVDSWYEPYVQTGYDNKIVVGVSASSFEPDAPLTRAAFVTMLYRLSSSPNVSGKVSEVLSDCEDSSWYSDAVLWAFQNKIADHTSSNYFSPDEELNRQQLADIVYNFAIYKGTVTKSSSSSYTDTDKISDWALPAVAYCTSSGIMNGISTTSFDPISTASRAMGAAVITRMAA